MIKNNINKFEKVSFNEFQKHFNFDVSLNYQDLSLPKRATKKSCGYDFFSPITFSLKPNESILIPTGIRVKMANNLFLMIVPRSSLGFNYRFQLDNTCGIIDADYYNSENEGHIFLKLTNNSFDNKTVNIKKGERIVQGIFMQYFLTEDDLEEELEFRNGGIGSTKK